MTKDDKSLLYACYVNDAQLTKERLKNATPAQLKKSTRETGTPLHIAAMNGNKAIIDLLLSAGINIEAGNFLSDSALLACIENGKLDTAKYLIEKGADVNKKGCQNRHSLSKLILYSWDESFAKYLLQKGCDINQTAIDKQSLLSDAASSNNKNAIDFLLANGISREYFHSALCWAIIHNAVDAVGCLLDSGADLDAMYAACKGIEKGLYHTVISRKGYGAMINLLIKKGIDFNKAPERTVVVGINKTKLSPIEYAKELLAKFPDATYILDNLKIVENS